MRVVKIEGRENGPVLIDVVMDVCEDCYKVHLLNFKVSYRYFWLQYFIVVDFLNLEVYYIFFKLLLY